MAIFQNDPYIKKFMEEIGQKLSFLDQSDKRKIFEKLLQAENKFRESLSKNPQSDKIYRLFVAHIVSERKNILTASPFFRVRSGFFTKFVSPAIKKVNLERLKTFPINYRFVKFVCDHWNGELTENLKKYKAKIEKYRNELIENDLPLVINRARVFYSKTPQSYLSFQDMIQIATEGLILGIDKYVGKFSKKYNSVTIGRMSSCMIEEYSSTMLHFYPSDRNLIYNVSSIRNKYKLESVDAAIEKYVDLKKSDKNNSKIDTGYLKNLMNAISPVSDEVLRTKPTDKSNVSISDILSIRNFEEEYEKIEKKDALLTIFNIIKEECTILEKKFLVLSGFVPYYVLFGNEE